MKNGIPGLQTAYTGDERSGLTQSNEIPITLRTNSMIAAPAPARAIFLGGVDSNGRAGALRIDYNINRQGPIPVYSFRRRRAGPSAAPASRTSADPRGSRAWAPLIVRTRPGRGS